MKRFNYDEDDEENLFSNIDGDDDEVEEEDIEEYSETIQRQETLTLMQLDLVQLDLNQRLLFEAIKLAKQSTWFFNFKSRKTQLKMISEAYEFLKKLSEAES